MKFTLALLVAVFSASCAKRIPDTAVIQPQPSAVHKAMQRHVQNAVDAGDGDGAVRLLRGRMAADPQNLDVRLELAEHYRKAGYGELALEHYRLAFERFPNEPKVVLGLAQALHDQQLTREAVQVLDRFAAGHKPTSSDLQAWLGYLNDQLADYAAAETAHRAALAASPSAKLHNNLGYNLLLQSKPDQAILEFRRALDLDPKMELARNNLALALIKLPTPTQQNRQEAFQQWLTNTGDPAAAHNNAAAALIEGGRFSEARQELDAALRVNRNYTPALKNLELLAQLDGQPAALPPSSSSGKQSSAPKRDAANNDPSSVTRTFKRLWNVIAGIDDRQPSGAVTRISE